MLLNSSWRRCCHKYPSHSCGCECNPAAKLGHGFKGTSTGTRVFFFKYRDFLQIFLSWNPTFFPPSGFSQFGDAWGCYILTVYHQLCPISVYICLSEFLVPQIGSKVHSQDTLHSNAFGKPAGHREVAPRELIVHSRWKSEREAEEKRRRIRRRRRRRQREDEDRAVKRKQLV